jgi:hypothetical protein
LLRHRQRGGAREVVVAPHDEGIKRVVGIEARILLRRPAIGDRLRSATGSGAFGLTAGPSGAATLVTGTPVATATLNLICNLWPEDIATTSLSRSR